MLLHQLVFAGSAFSESRRNWAAQQLSTRQGFTCACWVARGHPLKQLLDPSKTQELEMTGEDAAG